MTLLPRLREIIECKTNDLREYAQLCGCNAEYFFLGADFTGVDLRQQDLRGLKTDGVNWRGATWDTTTRTDANTRENLPVLCRGNWAISDVDISRLLNTVTELYTGSGTSTQWEEAIFRSFLSQSAKSALPIEGFSSGGTRRALDHKFAVECVLSLGQAQTAEKLARELQDGFVFAMLAVVRHVVRVDELSKELGVIMQSNNSQVIGSTLPTLSIESSVDGERPTLKINRDWQFA